MFPGTADERVSNLMRQDRVQSTTRKCQLLLGFGDTDAQRCFNDVETVVADGSEEYEGEARDETAVTSERLRGSSSQKRKRPKGAAGRTDLACVSARAEEAKIEHHQ